MALHGAGIFFILLIIIAISAVISYVAFTFLRARRLGLPPPTLSSYNPFQNSQSYSTAQSGPVGWVKTKIQAFKNRNNRSQTGAYEEPLSSNVRGRGNTRGHGPLDPDDAWDARVGNEADAYGPYNEENELGLHEPDTAYHGLAPGSEERGRSRSRGPDPYIGGSQSGLDRRYDEEMGLKPTHNPFDDSAEVADQSSLRGVSPRPVDAGAGPGHSRGRESVHSVGDERRSMFRENV